MPDAMNCRSLPLDLYMLIKWNREKYIANYLQYFLGNYTVTIQVKEKIDVLLI